MKKLEDLFEHFSAMSPEAQLEKIRTIRRSRTIERPAAAVKRVKKERKAAKKTANSAQQALAKLNPAQREALIAALQEKLKNGAK
jgi:hypothetical protein